jgi:tetratricopeptide (TPR) repeat protein
VAVIALGAAQAQAQAQPQPQPNPAGRAQAAAHFKQGQAYFQLKDFDRALAEYQAAFELSAEPLLIFNIGLCHDRANRPEPALAAFRRYLELVPNGSIADEAREDIARLTPIVEKLTTERSTAAARQREDAAKREEAARREEAERREEHADSRRRRVERYVILTGAAIAVAGATFHVLAWRTRDHLAKTTDPDDYFAKRDTFKLERTVAIGAYGVGALTIATGLILGHTLFRHSEGPQISAELTPRGASVLVGWSR